MNVAKTAKIYRGRGRVRNVPLCITDQKERCAKYEQYKSYGPVKARKVVIHSDDVCVGPLSSAEDILNSVLVINGSVEGDCPQILKELRCYISERVNGAQWQAFERYFKSVVNNVDISDRVSNIIHRFAVRDFSDSDVQEMSALIVSQISKKNVKLNLFKTIVGADMSVGYKQCDSGFEESSSESCVGDASDISVKSFESLSLNANMVR